VSPARFAALVGALLLAAVLSDAEPAHGQLPDAIPTWWHEAAGLTPLLTAPPPENPATICLIDTGVTPTPDLDITARWAYDGGTLDDVRATEESPGHGTVVAHFAAGKVNGWGGAGAFPHARISSVRVFPREGGAAWQDYIRAITRCVKLDTNTKVILISLGGQTIAPGEAFELEDYVGQARDLYDISVVVAAGNGGRQVDFPARFEAAVAIAANDSDGSLCSFSAIGPELDLAAPGCGLPQADGRGTAWLFDGTSFATPIVAGAIAAVRSYAPSTSAVEAEALLRTSAGPGEPPRVNAAAALAAAGVNFDAPAPSRGGTSAPPVNSASAAGPSDVLPRPSVVIRRKGHRVLLRAVNRPSGVWFEVESGRLRIRRRSTRVRFTTTRRSARCRFSRASHASRRTVVRW
jgi:subtilisin family serine protease